MSNRDYANRRPQSGAKPRPIRATRARPAAKKAPPRRKLPIPLILFAFVAVGSFGYFLWSIKDTAKQEAPVEVKTEKEVKAREPAATLTPKVKEVERQEVAVAAPVEEQPVVEVPKKDPNALPPKPKEEWTYLDELENKHVEVDIPDVVATRAPQQYQLQCASFRQESQANQMKAVIAFQGLEAQVRQIEGTSGTWYKVILGPYERKRDAERKRHTLQNAGINGCQLLAIPK
ncbi:MULTISPECIES: SPOR domain-containing protein [Shewanella]|uniref:SPOR domain-containing protein n=1 Tax=Shewanella TaxID=22 RepID=UPI000310681F|nr:MULTISPECIES: SPOR domain-containing protein [Shewanella]PWH02226.1 sporulation protein [Shewanella xiamenensis]BDQ64711.1 cell division protein FtsN [Shewanella xiamenensis]GLD77772.1 cell division protein FtsN [Shewanella xiamenensis]